MRQISLVLLLIILAAFSGCTKSMRYSAEEIRDFPPPVQEHIKNNEVALGMTMLQVRYAWGGPDMVNFLTPGEDEKERVEWVYKKMPFFKTRLIFTGGILTGIISSEPGTVK